MARNSPTIVQTKVLKLYSRFFDVGSIPTKQKTNEVFIIFYFFGLKEVSSSLPGSQWERIAVIKISPQNIYYTLYAQTKSICHFSYRLSSSLTLHAIMNSIGRSTTPAPRLKESRYYNEQ